MVRLVRAVPVLTFLVFAQLTLTDPQPVVGSGFSRTIGSDLNDSNVEPPNIPNDPNGPNHE